MNWSNVPILMYHHVVPADEVAPLAPYAVSRDLFACQLDHLQSRGYRTLTLSALCDLWDNGGKGWEGGKPVALTFDDCPAALLDCAVPELLRRGMTATFFAVAGKLGGYNEWDAGQVPAVSLMSAADLPGLAASGFEIGSHGLTHRHLRACSPETVTVEMSESRQRLQAITGQRVDFFAYPFGEYPDGYAEQCRAAGYRGAVSIFSAARTVAADRYCMRRVLIHEGDRGMRFDIKLGLRYLWLRRFVDWRLLRLDTRE